MIPHNLEKYPLDIWLCSGSFLSFRMRGANRLSNSCVGVRIIKFYVCVKWNQLNKIMGNAWSVERINLNKLNSKPTHKSIQILTEYKRKTTKWKSCVCIKVLSLQFSREIPRIYWWFSLLACNIWWMVNYDHKTTAVCAQQGNFRTPTIILTFQSDVSIPLFVLQPKLLHM